MSQKPHIEKPRDEASGCRRDRQKGAKPDHTRPQFDALPGVLFFSANTGIAAFHPLRGIPSDPPEPGLYPAGECAEIKYPCQTDEYNKSDDQYVKPKYVGQSQPQAVNAPAVFLAAQALSAFFAFSVFSVFFACFIPAAGDQQASAGNFCGNIEQ